MDGEDWPDPLPEGWILKKFSNGKVWAHNAQTKQTFHTKKDLLRYVHFAETILPLFAYKTIPNQDSKGKAIDNNAGNSSKASDDGEGNSEQSSDGEDDDDDDSLYGGIDFSEGIWSVEVEMIDRSNPQPERKKDQDDQQSKGKAKVEDDQQLKGKTNIQDDQQLKGKGKTKIQDDQQLKGKTKIQDDQQLKGEGKTKIQDDLQLKMKMETKLGTEHMRNKRAGPQKKFEMPPKRFRGWTKDHPKP